MVTIAVKIIKQEDITSQLLKQHFGFLNALKYPLIKMTVTVKTMALFYQAGAKI